MYSHQKLIIDAIKRQPGSENGVPRSSLATAILGKEVGHALAESFQRRIDLLIGLGLLSEENGLIFTRERRMPWT